MNPPKDTPTAPTKGPWRLTPTSGRTRSGGILFLIEKVVGPSAVQNIADICDVCELSTPEQLEANARLMASAPALYEALDELLYDVCSPGHDLTASRKIRAKGYAALAQARGDAK